MEDLKRFVKTINVGLLWYLSLHFTLGAIANFLPQAQIRRVLPIAVLFALYRAYSTYKYYDLLCLEKSSQVSKRIRYLAILAILKIRTFIVVIITLVITSYLLELFIT